MVLASMVRMAPAAKDCIRATTSSEAPSRKKKPSSAANAETSKLEGDGGDQDPGTERHDRGYEAWGSPDIDADERPQEKRSPSHEPPETRRQRLQNVDRKLPYHCERRS
jgi:hypothetical protein